MGGEVDDGEVDVRIGEGSCCCSVECSELLSGGEFGVLILVIESNREDKNFGGRRGFGLLYCFEEMVEVSSRVAVQLNGGIVVGGDPVDV